MKHTSGYIECSAPGCTGDARYAPPGRGHTTCMELASCPQYVHGWRQPTPNGECPWCALEDLEQQQRQWEDWSNELALLIPEELAAGNPEGAQESIITDTLRELIRWRLTVAQLARHETSQNGHTFRFWFDIRASSKVTGDPEYTDAPDFMGPVHEVQVRAWSLSTALHKAAQLPILELLGTEVSDGPLQRTRPTCGGCEGLGRHRRWCREVVGFAASIYGPMAERLEQMGDEVGPNNYELSNRLWALSSQTREWAESLTTRVEE